MPSLYLACLLLSYVLSAASEGMEVEMEGVEEIKDISELDGWWLIALYMEGCSFCEALAPEWKALGAAVGEKYDDLRVGKASGKTEKVSGLDEGYPTIFLMAPDGKITEFKEHNNRVLHRFLIFIEDHTPYTIDGSVRAMSEEIQAGLNRVYYYWDHDAEKASPLTPLAEMVELIKKGVVNRRTLVAIPGDKDWSPAKRFDALKEYFKEENVVAAASEESNDGLYELTDSTFDEHVRDGRTWLVAFYVPACGFCKRLKPEFEALAAAVTGANPRYAVARVNCEKNPDLAAKHSISGYPTIFALTASQDRVDFTDHPNRVKSRFLEFLEEVGKKSVFEKEDAAEEEL